MQIDIIFMKAMEINFEILRLCFYNKRLKFPRMFLIERVIMVLSNISLTKRWLHVPLAKNREFKKVRGLNNFPTAGGY